MESGVKSLAKGEDRCEKFSDLRRPDAGERMAAALEKIASLGSVVSIEDPVCWQRELRCDRPLPGRKSKET